MARETSTPGRLIAVEGTRGADVEAEARALLDRLRRRGIDAAISRWDASGLFADLLFADAADVALTPRMLALMYAADLVFRLRWEIQPALAEGRVVIAAPYARTALAVGIGLELPETWLQAVFRFAPVADTTRMARERRRGRGWRPRPARGFGEFSTTVLSALPSGIKRRVTRAGAMAWLAATAVKPPRRRAVVDSLAGYERQAGSAAAPHPQAARADRSARRSAR